jgi:hypothetical protein
MSELRRPIRLHKFDKKWIKKLESFQLTPIDPKIIEKFKGIIGKKPKKPTMLTYEELEKFFRDEVGEIEKQVRTFIITSSAFYVSSVNLTDGLFIKVKDTESLLSIAGFLSTPNSNMEFNIWQISKIFSQPVPKDPYDRQERINSLKGHYQTLQENLILIQDPTSPLIFRDIEEIIMEYLH